MLKSLPRVSEHALANTNSKETREEGDVSYMKHTAQDLIENRQKGIGYGSIQ